MLDSLLAIGGLVLLRGEGSRHAVVALGLAEGAGAWRTRWGWIPS